MQKKSVLKKSSSLKAKTSLKKTKSKPRKKDPESISALKKEADRLVSIYVLYRDGEKRSDGWYSQCITCDKWIKLPLTKKGEIDRRVIHWGHFQSSRHNNTRYDERNVHAQCYVCNVRRQGEQYKYSLAITRKYGEGIVEELVELALMLHPFTKDELKQIIHDAQVRVDYMIKTG